MTHPLSGALDQGTEAPKSLHEAAERGNVSYITRTVERTLDLDINQVDNLQRTALHWAAEMGHIQAAEALLDYGIKADAVECNGRTAVHLAARSCNPEMLQVIFESVPSEKREALANQKDNSGITAVFLAMQKGDEGRETFQTLMRHGAKYG
eukprot:CAMPEP_0119102108 /NCGR_PEP_ID=MMETSP1180-20130426/966_1 /TAXON_ID=3052 ORGANISM="Chlamydomonas cf sp, Strain CCMP681" /NCGR_SAMPLE_ID=MMETSP1180 /ASSEMBLY_ACC=CAM_ASM_000741 /LENGTH=151 /DNA_ID=CAMNT_0007086335 /DNA_START=110 /DNA_END=565 /DNA_ORIENTATION=-